MPNPFDVVMLSAMQSDKLIDSISERLEKVHHSKIGDFCDYKTEGNDGVR